MRVHRLSLSIALVLLIYLYFKVCWTIFRVLYSNLGSVLSSPNILVTSKKVNKHNFLFSIIFTRTITWFLFAVQHPCSILLYIRVSISKATAKCRCINCFSFLNYRILSANNMISDFNCMTFYFRESQRRSAKQKIFVLSFSVWLFYFWIVRIWTKINK